MPGRLTLAQARRAALAAQGFGRLPDAVGTRQLQTLVGRVGQFQIDSVNVVARAHYLPAFSRLGPYDVTLLDRAAGVAPRRLFEYWGHEASLLDVSLQPFLRFRMAGVHPWGRVRRLMDERPALIHQVLADVGARPGGVTARQLDADPRRSASHWGWNWSDVKVACEWLFHAGQLSVSRRNASFERLYDLPERVLPAAVLAHPTPSEEDARVELARRALRALGVADVRAVADYFRLGSAPTRSALEGLVAAGAAERVEVEGLRGDWYLSTSAALPRTVPGASLVSPFDSAVFERRRLQALFGFHYRIEIYVPAAQRRHGYYVYPFRLGDAFAARVDLKADRAAGVLLVQSAWLEEGFTPDAVAPALASELVRLALWLGLGGVRVGEVGTLGAALAAAVA